MDAGTATAAPPGERCPRLRALSRCARRADFDPTYLTLRSISDLRDMVFAIRARLRGGGLRSRLPHRAELGSDARQRTGGPVDPAGLEGVRSVCAREGYRETWIA